MLRTNYRCVQSPSISVDVAKCGENFANSPTALTFCLLQKMTCLDWTIYSRSFNSLGCPLMLRTNYRCVQSPSHFCRQSKSDCAVGEFAKFFTHSHCVSEFVLHKRTILMMLQTTKEWVYWREIVKFSQIHPEYSLLPATKNDLTWLNNLIETVRLQLIRMSSYANNKLLYRCVQSPNISVDVAKCVESFHKFTQYTHF